MRGTEGLTALELWKGQQYRKESAKPEVTFHLSSLPRLAPTVHSELNIRYLYTLSRK